MKKLSFLIAICLMHNNSYSMRQPLDIYCPVVPRRSNQISYPAPSCGNCTDWSISYNSLEQEKNRLANQISTLQNINYLLENKIHEVENKNRILEDKIRLLEEELEKREPVFHDEPPPYEN